MSESTRSDANSSQFTTGRFDNISYAERIYAVLSTHTGKSVDEIASEARCSRKKTQSFLQTLESFDQILVEEGASNPRIIKNPSIPWAARLMQTVLSSESKSELLDRRLTLESEIEAMKEDYDVDGLDEFREKHVDEVDTEEALRNPAGGHWEASAWEQCQHHIVLLDAALENYESLSMLAESIPFSVGNPNEQSLLFD